MKDGYRLGAWGCSAQARSHRATEKDPWRKNKEGYATDQV